MMAMLTSTARCERNTLESMATPQDKSKAPTRPRSASTLNRDMTPLRAALNLALVDGHVTTDASWKAKMRPLKDADRRRDVYLDLAQRRALIAKAPADLALFMSALSLVPLRPGAMAALVVGNFDKRLSTLTIDKDKHGQDRKITLPPATAAFFAEQCNNKLPTAPLLTRADGSAWNKDAWKYPFKAAVVAAELAAAATAYALRHSTITDLIVLQARHAHRGTVVGHQPADDREALRSPASRACREGPGIADVVGHGEAGSFRSNNPMDYTSRRCC